MAWSLKPLGDRVVVKPKSRDETSRGGIVLPDTAREKPQQGEVLSVGPGRQLDSGKRVELDLKVGDTVLFAKYGGTEFKHEDDDLLILSERDILAVIENGKN
jgi:chaperonin GroES